MNTTKKTLTIRVNGLLHKKYKAACANQGLKMDGKIIPAVEQIMKGVINDNKRTKKIRKV